MGDGSIKPGPVWRPLVPVIGRGHVGLNDHDKPPRRRFQNPLLLFLRPDVSLLLFFNGILYAVFYGVTASISSLFSDIYPFLSETDIGLCFLAIGGGMLFGSWFTGIFLDKEYRRVKERMEKRCRDDPECKIRIEDVTKDENFPIEYARFRTMPVYFVIYVAACIGYGWCLEAKVNIAGPLILQIISKSYPPHYQIGEIDDYIVGYVIVTIMNATQTLIIDLAPSQGSSITACVSHPYLRCRYVSVAYCVVFTEQSCKMFPWSRLRLSHQLDYHCNRRWLDVRSPFRVVHRSITHYVYNHTHGSTVEGEGAGKTSSCQSEG